jgi:nucleotidyltransferase substrate binding protein (TIGR01987 family)
MNTKTLNKAFCSLKDGYETFASNNQNNVVKDMLADSCVKRFEYTIELAIKTMKRLLKEIYFIDEKDLTVNNIFRLMEGYGFIKSWIQWKEYYKNRNNTVHEYDIEKSRELLKLIPNFIEDTAFLVEKLLITLEQNND